MISENDNVEPAQDDSTGDSLGPRGSALSFTDRRDRELEHRAVRERWPMTPEIRQRILDNAVADLELEDPKYRQGAFKLLVMMEAQNQRDEHHRSGATVRHEHTVDIKALAEIMRSEDGYVDYIRRRTRERDTDPGAVCQQRLEEQARNLENGR